MDIEPFSMEVKGRLIIVLCLVLTLAAVRNVHANPASCEGITEGYQCVCNDNNHKISIECIDTNLQTVPKNLTNPYRMVFNKNNFEVLDKMDYGDLVYLDLSVNNIRYIREGAFSELSHLTHLDLSTNLISGLHAGTFAGLKSLQTLLLSHNPLQAIPQDTFLGSDLPSLQILTLKQCHLHYIEDNAIDTLTNLTHFNASGNNLLFIPRIGKDANLEKLLSLDFTHNIIEKVSDSWFVRLINLKELYLSHNKFNYLSGGVFAGLAALQRLHLRNAWITLMDFGAFENLTSLETLDITFNMVTRLDGDRLPWKNLQRILLHDNPWECSCQNSWLVTQPKVQQYNKNVNGTNMKYDNVCSVYNIG